MPNKTLSIREDDLPLWERAGRAARNNRSTLSALVTSALARYLEPTDTIMVQMYEPYGARRLEAFSGRWLTDPQLDSASDPKQHELPHKGPFGQKGAEVEWRAGIAETSKGRIAIYLHHWEYLREFPPELVAFDDLDAAQGAHGDDARIPEDAWDLARIALTRTPVVWRDI
ncbi:hypothetical protein [Nonomuraea dietziae]|uniref:hypothetical protein n=1 Tax=Nonomuraea dietziae TaxID=65515 RepID=UPI0034131161